MQLGRGRKIFKVLVVFCFLSRRVGTGYSFYYSLNSTYMFSTLYDIFHNLKNSNANAISLIFVSCK